MKMTYQSRLLGMDLGLKEREKGEVSHTDSPKTALARAPY